MTDDLTTEQVASLEDIDVLWRSLAEAKQRHDAVLVRAIENRMRQLSQERRFAHLTDEQLTAQIRGASGNREPTDLLAYSPASGQGLEGAADTADFNRRIRQNQQDGVEATLAALMDEWRRRQRHAE